MVERTKICKSCETEKPISKFYKNKKNIDGYENNCKKCREKRKTEIKSITREQIKEFKKTLKCSNCGNSDYRVLDFHHVNPNEKEMGISEMLSNRYTFEKIKKEIDKCIVLCSNCHRIHHYEERKNLTIEPRYDLMKFHLIDGEKNESGTSRKDWLRCR